MYCVTCSGTIHNSVQHMFKISIVYTTILLNSCIIHFTMHSDNISGSGSPQMIICWMIAMRTFGGSTTVSVLFLLPSSSMLTTVLLRIVVVFFLFFLFFSSREKTSLPEFSATICSIKCFAKHPLTRGYYHLFLAPLKFGCCHGHRID